MSSNNPWYLWTAIFDLALFYLTFISFINFIDHCCFLHLLFQCSVYVVWMWAYISRQYDEPRLLTESSINKGFTYLLTYL